MADDKPIHELRFEAAVKVIQSLPKNGSFQPSNEMMLQFYSYYKQATQGPCNLPRPGFWDPIGKYKWDAWNGLGDMSREEAMIAYVEEMKKIIETMPMTEKVEELLHVLGPFYEIIEDNKKIHSVSDLSSGIGNMLTSTPNLKELNGIQEGSDSGPESESDNEEDEEEEEDEDEEKEESEKEDSVTDLKLMIEDSAAKEKIPLANGNAENQHPSVVNGSPSNRSVLNGNNSEEKLNQKSQTLESPELSDVNSHVTEHSEDVSSLHHLTSDSDSEVYCDSMEQLVQEESSEVFLNHSLEFQEVNHSQLSPRMDLPEPVQLWSVDESRAAGSLQGGAEGVKRGGEDGKPSGSGTQKERLEKTGYSGLQQGRGSRTQATGGGVQGVQLGSGGDGDRWGTEDLARGSLNEQIAAVLTRLQEDMKSVLQRLHTLEAQTQARSLTLQPSYPSSVNKKPSWWPFDISPGTLALALIWPFVAQWLVRLYLQRRRRKMK
ncbi:acyl-CoA-binding domain-containing protein 5 isoform X2 [Acipenser ruthenus]|uniref:acyl-CoA-binding domain-containing protein 5 isoform X2 n=2 Tax=Acipenser ruthenus TaxID=7906 RepID=UPI00274050CF|nr:acyl-CoA-binding domain-containing protein 5 isoform X2 [Acipenser ruthenus]